MSNDIRVPLIVLSGFLGAGKTTLLNHLLKNASGRKLVVLVNDVGEVNIDASLVSECATVSPTSADSVVELSNGCICCGIQNDFGQSVLDLADAKPDGIIVEATGIAEPMGILRSLNQAAPDGRTPSDFVRLLNMLTVVGADWWLRQMKGAYAVAPRRSLMLFSDPRRPLGELLSLQVECSDLIVLNKIDLVPDSEIGLLETALKAINTRAEIVPVLEGALDPEQLWSNARFDEEQTPYGSRCDIELSVSGAKNKEENISGPRHNHGEFGLEVFTYRSRYPLKHDGLIKLMRGGIRGLLRAKGYFWSDKCPDRVGFLSLAGDSLRADHLGEWYFTLLQKGLLDRSQIPAGAWKVWDDAHGDRRQEIVFIGIDLDRKKIEEALEGLASEKHSAS